MVSMARQYRFLIVLVVSAALVCGILAPAVWAAGGTGGKCGESTTKVTGYLDNQAYEVYYFEVPSGTKIQTLRLSSESNALVSIYVRKGALAGPSSSDASASVRNGRTEVTLTNPVQGRYWVQVRASSGSGMYTLAGVTTTVSGGTKKTSATTFHDDCCPEAVPMRNTATEISCPAGSHWAFMDCTCTGMANIYGCVRDEGTTPQPTPARTSKALVPTPKKTQTKRITTPVTTRTAVVVTRTAVPTANPAAVAVRPVTGTLVSGTVPFGGDGQFTIDNRQGSSDAVAVMTRSGSLAPVAAFYIRKGDSYKLTSVPDATYTLYFVLGSDWDQAQKLFMTNPRYQKVVDPFPFTSDWDSYTVASVTLYGVSDGNTAPQGVGKEQFPVL
jgi:hypothetical protein